MVKRPEDARLGVGQSFAFGFQHVLTLYGGAIAPPLIIGAAAGLDAAGISILLAGAMFVGGLGTMLQSWGLPFFGSQLPLVQGVSFSGVASMLVILQGGGGLPEVFGAVLVASVVALDRKSTRLNSSHVAISYAVFCLKQKTLQTNLKSTK